MSSFPRTIPTIDPNRMRRNCTECLGEIICKVELRVWIEAD